jgi:hypothetical protein
METTLTIASVAFERVWRTGESVASIAGIQEPYTDQPWTNLDPRYLYRIGSVISLYSSYRGIGLEREERFRACLNMSDAKSRHHGLRVHVLECSIPLARSEPQYMTAY